MKDEKIPLLPDLGTLLLPSLVLFGRVSQSLVNGGVAHGGQLALVHGVEAHSKEPFRMKPRGVSVLHCTLGPPLLLKEMPHLITVKVKGFLLFSLVFFQFLPHLRAGLSKFL